MQYLDLLYKVNFASNRDNVPDFVYIETGCKISKIFPQTSVITTRKGGTGHSG